MTERTIQDSLNFCIPIYLNQQIVFDLLAIIDDGLSDVTTIKTSVTGSERKNTSAEAGVGISNLLSLVGVSFGGRVKAENESDSGQHVESSEKKVHTPSSLFSKLRTNLKKQGLVNEITTIEDFNQLESGMFVEFKAVLSKNPLIDSLERILQLMEMALPFSEESEATPHVKGKRKDTQKSTQNEVVLNKLKGLTAELNKSNSIEVFGEITETEINAVLSAKADYFINQNIEELIDGEYRIFGKVIRTISSESTDSINLLRKTSFGLLNKAFIESFCSIFGEVEESGFEISEIITEIKSPAIQIIPITIFT